MQQIDEAEGEVATVFSRISEFMTEFTQTSPLNKVPELSDLQIFDAPLLGVADVSDPLFGRLKQPDAVGPHHLLPQEWLPGSLRVLSYFLPFTLAVRQSNRQAGLPSTEWLYGRIEGQVFNNALARATAEWLNQAGFRALVPALDPRFAVTERRSNWSERHVAFIAGLGTLSLNRSLITKQGAAGRLGSLVTDLSLPVTERYYSEIEENCSHCGACIHRCPPQAIDKSGKDHAVCSGYLDGVMRKYAPRYGCGKCQTAVPCESQIPKGI